MDGMFEMNPALGIYSPKKKRVGRAKRAGKAKLSESVQAERDASRMRKEMMTREEKEMMREEKRKEKAAEKAARRMRKEMREEARAYRAKRYFAKLMGQNMSPDTVAFFDKIRKKARNKYAARESVQAARQARRMRKEMRDESMEAKKAAKRAARELKRRRAKARGPINRITMSPGTIEAIMTRRARAAAAALKRRMRDPAFAARYQKKVLGQKYRQAGRLLGGRYKASLPTRQARQIKRATRAGVPPEMLKNLPKLLGTRKQGGVGLKSKYDGLIGTNTSVVRMHGNGDYSSKASLMDYAQLMRDKARAAYVARKRRLGKGSAVRTPMTAAQKKAKRKAAYEAKKTKAASLSEALALEALMGRGDDSPVSSIGDLESLRDVSAMFSPAVTRSRARASASARAAAAAAAAKKTRRASVPATNRVLRSSMGPMRLRSMGR